MIPVAQLVPLKAAPGGKSEMLAVVALGLLALFGAALYAAEKQKAPSGTRASWKQP